MSKHVYLVVNDVPIVKVGSDNVPRDAAGNVVILTVTNGVAKDEEGTVVSVIYPPKPEPSFMEGLANDITEHPSILAWAIGLGAIGYLITSKSGVVKDLPGPMKAGAYIGSAGSMALIGLFVGEIRAKGIK